MEFHCRKEENSVSTKLSITQPNLPINQVMYQEDNQVDLLTILYDFRSDTVTIPCDKMRLAMMNALVGDDVYNEDPTVNLLEKTMAQLTGFESALFCATGTMANQLAIRTHLKQPPYSILLDSQSHIHCYENGGAAFHCGASTTALNSSNSKYLTREDVERGIIEPDLYSPPTQLIALEIPSSGEIMPFEIMSQIQDLAQGKSIPIHLDGARLWNASITTGISMKEYCINFDSGMGTPIGSVLLGSNQFIQKAKWFRKLFGGGWRQAGGLAAACLYSLKTYPTELMEDHKATLTLSKNLKDLGFSITKQVETNMLWLNSKSLGMTWDGEGGLNSLLKLSGIRVNGTGFECRLVIHRDCRQGVNLFAQVIKLKLDSINSKFKSSLVIQ